MLASDTHKVALKLLATWRRSLGVCAVSLSLLAISECGQSDGQFDAPPALAGLDPHMITQRGGLHFVSDVATGCRRAAEQGQPCLLFFTADWCTFCHQMEETSFKDSLVAEMARNFVCVLVDADREPDVCQRFSVTGYPTIQFVSANGRELNRLVGRQSASELLSGMRAALKRYAWLTDSKTKVR